MNIAHRIAAIARQYPDKRSVVFPKRVGRKYQYSSYTFAQFEARSNQMANYFQRSGIGRGTRTLLFVNPRLDFAVITFALFKVGAIPVLIDPGMGLKNLLHSVKQVRAQALIGIGRIHWLRRLLMPYFKEVEIKISLDNIGGRTDYLYQRFSSEDSNFEPLEVNPEDYAAILFTSGGTGIPKGVLYTHGILNAQTDALQSMFSLDETQIDLPGFPLFALFTLAMGMTSVIPDMDPTKPASANPAKLVQNILDQDVTFVAGSPAIWEKVGKYCQQKNIQLGKLKQVVMFGAPVRGEIHQLFKKVLLNGDTFTPYGATECLPVSLISGSEVLTQTWAQTLTGAGTCVGQAIPGTEIKILKTSDIPEANLQELPAFEIGEIAVCGSQVTPAYFEMDHETHQAKIKSNGKLWHRMGDLGYLDQEKRLWFLGRKSHRVEVSPDKIFYPIEVEAIFNQHPEVRRTALIKIKKHGEIAPGLVIERHDRQTRITAAFLNEIKMLGHLSEKTKSISDFYLCESFPVDVRHNIKIDRLKLSHWAQKQGTSRCLRKVSS